jgi:hypothetical protein
MGKVIAAGSKGFRERWRKLDRGTRRMGRRLTANRRPLPDFIIIGAQKSGTTSLIRYLCQHPEITTSYKKEVHYFDQHFRRGVNWYRSNFPPVRFHSPKLRVGETSPYYFFHPHVPRRIHELLPDVKLIVSLRDPTSRAISHFQHEANRGREPLSLGEALDAESERIEAETRALLENEDLVCEEHRRHSYKARGLYLDQLERYWEVFDPSQVQIVDANRFFRDPRSVLRELFGILGVDPEYEVAKLTPHNIGSPSTEVDPAIVKDLDDYFRPHNEELFRALDQEFEWTRS